MAQRSSNAGCIILVAILAVVAVGAVLAMALFYTKRGAPMPAHERTHATELHMVSGDGVEDRLVFTQSDRPVLSVPAPGEEVTLELLTAYMIDDTATDLAKDGFRKAADKAEVSWKMKLSQVSDRNGELRGQFKVPWQMRHGHGSTTSSFGVEVMFDEAERAALLKLRRGEWVTVEGQLDLSSGSARINGAVLSDAPATEKP